MSVFTNPAAGAAEDADAYIQAVLGLLGDLDPQEVLRTTDAWSRQLLGSLSERQRTTPEAPGKWSVAQVIQHLADSELVWGMRLRRVLAEDRPALTGFDQDLWAHRLRYVDADPEEALATFGALRRANLALLARMPAGDLERVGVHAERGEESVRHMIRLYAGHDLAHRSQLARIASAVSQEPSAR